MRDWTHNYDFDKPLSDGYHHLRFGKVTCFEINHEVDHVQWTTYAKFKCHNQDLNRQIDGNLETSLHSAYDFSCVQETIIDLVFKKGNRIDPTPGPSTVTTPEQSTTPETSTSQPPTISTTELTFTTTTSTTTQPTTTTQPPTTQTTTTPEPSTTLTSTTELETTTDEK